MTDIPLQDELVESIIEFASAEIRDPTQACGYFGSYWAPTEAPSLKSCRAIQREVQDWLNGNSYLNAVNAAMGLSTKGGEDSGIVLLGKPGFSAEWHDDQFQQRIHLSWWVQKGTLRAICGFAITTLYQSNLINRVGQCSRKASFSSDGQVRDADCKRFFIDRKSRGRKRKYCMTPGCEAARNRQRVRASREKQ